ncbi:MAG: hypothetical protein ACPG19_02815 [Saprospiraceae bacterium]
MKKTIPHNQIKWSYWLFPLVAFLGVFSTFQSNGFLELELKEPEKVELIFSNKKENQKSVLLLDNFYQKTLFTDLSILAKQQQIIALFNYNQRSEVVYNVINQSFLSYQSSLFYNQITYNFLQRKSSKYAFLSIIG